MKKEKPNKTIMETIEKIKEALTTIKCNSDNKDVLMAVKVIEFKLKDLKK